MDMVPAKIIVTRSPKGAGWFGHDYNMNIYRGCCHGCIYCDSRSECYRIENFDQVRAKENALAIIAKELASKVKRGVVATGAMSDPYNPFEAQEELTRHALELLSAYGFGVAIDTKSDLVARDVDVLEEMKAQAPVIVKLTVTTASDALCKIVEPYAPPTSRRFAAIRTLAERGIFTGVILMPVLPFITDTQENVTAIVEAAAKSGARFVYPSLGVTLRQNQRDYFYARLDEHFPGLKERYQKQYGPSYQCSSPDAKILWETLKTACKKYGLLYKMQEIISAYKQGYSSMGQLSLFNG